jgi:hypothetical protein
MKVLPVASTPNGKYRRGVQAPPATAPVLTFGVSPVDVLGAALDGVVRLGVDGLVDDVDGVIDVVGYPTVR